MIDYTLDESRASAVLTLKGPATVQQAQKLHSALLDIAGKVQHLTLNISGITVADLSVLQLLCSAHRHLLRSGGRLTLAGPVSHGLREAITNAGFAVCAGHDDNSGLWTGDVD